MMWSPMRKSHIGLTVPCVTTGIMRYECMMKTNASSPKNASSDL